MEGEAYSHCSSLILLTAILVQTPSLSLLTEHTSDLELPGLQTQTRAASLIDPFYFEVPSFLNQVATDFPTVILCSLQYKLT